MSLLPFDLLNFEDPPKIGPMENLALTVGKNLSALRKREGLTQQELAQQIHYSDKSISKWELGYSLPSVDVLLDFANYYGVSLDYLTKEQDEAAIEQAVEEKKKVENNSNKAIILAMSLTFVLLVAMCIYFSSYFFKETAVSLWIVFVWMVPVMAFLSAWEVKLMYHNRLAVFVLASVFLWTFILSFGIHFQFFLQPGENIWFTLIVGIPIQVIIALLYRYKKA